MSILPDKWIKTCSSIKEMIKPFHENLKEKGVISYGVSSYGYDVSLAPEFKIFFDQPHSSDFIIDPKNFDEDNICFKCEQDSIVIPPNNFVLGRTVEYLKIPDDVTGIFFTKSTYARVGCNITTTVLEAGWEGELVVEIYNTTKFPIRVYANEGIGQILFFKGNEKCQVSYKDRGGKYMNQRGVTTAKVKS